MSQKPGLLGNFEIGKGAFPHLDSLFKKFQTKDFIGSIDRKRSEMINRSLCELIQKEPEPCFLLPHVLGFVEKVGREKLLHHYNFTSFEIWLNQYSGLSAEENYRVRAKVAGKWIERSDYQVLFPIGMGKVYPGTHFVTAHKSPDLDTTIASFWGWLDAFAARVGDGLHVWNLPEGPPPSQIEIDWIFRDLFGPAVFTHLPKTRTLLNLSGNDLMSQKGFLRKTPDELLASIDHEGERNSVVIVDSEGFYLGDWRNLDVEGVQQVIILLSSCLRWFENHLHLQMISLFAKEKLHFDEIKPLLDSLFGMTLEECEPARQFSSKQKVQVEHFLVRVLGFKKGMKDSFEGLGKGLSAMGEVPFEGTHELLARMKKLFDAKGLLVEARPKIFHFLEIAVKTLHEAIFKIRGRLERLDVALKTKSEVFGDSPVFVTVRSTLEEIQNKMGNHPYLTVTYPDEGRFFPVGIIQAADVRKNSLGTVSLRDFCNRDEMGIPPYLEVISVIDHHKSALNTFSAPMAIISDAQSSNSLVADLAIEINDRYSLLGQNEAQIGKLLEDVGSGSTPMDRRLLLRLLERKRAAEMKGHFFIDPAREYIEYLHFLYGILDDTDLLSKVSQIDVEVVASLLNRLKTLSVQKETEIIQLDDLPRDKSFPKKAAQRILQNEDMYSLYRKVYAYREKEVAKNLELAANGESSNLFADTKEQNGCCRVGQTKIFANNLELFEKNGAAIQRVWVKKAQEVFKKTPEIDLHIHMISTIVSADEVYRGTQGKYHHKDQLWIWINGNDSSREHLKHFLSSFQNSPGLKNNPLELEFLGDNAADLSELFKESFIEVTEVKDHHQKQIPIAVLKYNAGSLNSRKAMISPFLPTL